MKIEEILVAHIRRDENGVLRLFTKFVTQITMAKNDYHEIHPAKPNVKMKEISL